MAATTGGRIARPIGLIGPGEASPLGIIAPLPPHPPWARWAPLGATSHAQPRIARLDKDDLSRRQGAMAHCE